jgi:hypothetical protein
MAVTLDVACNDTIELSEFIELVNKSSDHLSTDVLLSHGEHLQMLSNILEGRQPATLELGDLLKQFPVEWDRQLGSLTEG